MKFKTKEELIDECGPKEGDEDTTWDIGEYGKECIKKAFKSFTERIEFYKKYENIPNGRDTTGIELFARDFPEIYEHTNFSEAGWWNDWLLDYCFGDMI